MKRVKNKAHLALAIAAKSRSVLLKLSFIESNSKSIVAPAVSNVTRTSEQMTHNLALQKLVNAMFELISYLVFTIKKSTI